MSSTAVALNVQAYLAGLVPTFNSLSIIYTDSVLVLVEMEDELLPVVEVTPAGIEASRLERNAKHKVYTIRVTPRYKVKPTEMAGLNALAKQFVDWAENLGDLLLLYRSASAGCVSIDARSSVNGEFFQGTNQLLTTIDAKILVVE